MDRYQKELDEKLKKFDKEEVIETWEERAKRMEKERKESLRIFHSFSKGGFQISILFSICLFLQ